MKAEPWVVEASPELVQQSVDVEATGREYESVDPALAQASVELVHG